MRILIPHNQGHEGRDPEVESEDEEEEDRGLWTEEELAERDLEEGEENLLAITPATNANHDQANLSVSILG
ncbi:hypothetical protein A2U01_0078692, partial [Trifolium medium]|nr:hypothetical protein [Trifolium medium]